MATAPISIVWGSTTSNIETLTPTQQGNGIVFESDIVSDFMNGALNYQSQATRNLQVMGGYYDAGQSYKNYQYCSQISYVNGEPTLGFYMATQDNPTLTPTDASLNQTGTTDMQIPVDPTTVQAGWQQIKFIPNQDHLVFLDQDNTFTGSNTFQQVTASGLKINGQSTFGYDTTFNGSITVTGSSTFKQSVTFKSSITANNITCNTYLVGTGSNIFTMQSQSLGTKTFSIAPNNPTQPWQILFGDAYGNSQASYYVYPSTGELSHTLKAFVSGNVVLAKSKVTPIAFSQSTNTPFYVLSFEDANTNVFNSLTFTKGSGSNRGVRFYAQTIIGNASFGSVNFALDPVWEQDYATANYVNQKSLDLYEEIDARLSAIEAQLGIPKVASRGVDIKTRLASMEVAKSPITELFEKINNMQGYEGVLEQSNEEERLALSQARNDETEVMEIVNSIKDRIEREAKKREEAEAQSQKEQTQESSSKTRTRKKS